MHYLKIYSLKYIVIVIIILAGCSKNNNNPGNTGGGNNGGDNNEDTNCIVTTISQVNSGTGAESSLSASYNSSYAVIKLILYDSVNKIKNFEADFNYITADSVRIDQYQYMLLDAQKRIVKFVTKADMAHPQNTDDYTFIYTYNSNGYLITKNLFINNSAVANFNTTYTYSNNQLISCLMITPSAGNLKVLESTLSYNNNLTIKNWIYTFPDAMEGYIYLTLLNFGKHVVNPLQKVVTKIYEPNSGSMIDTWTTSYSNYKTDDNGYILSGEANGDLQQGIASFYGKTNFYYNCH